MKRLLLLGGLRYLLPVIDAAHKLGCYVITCDYLPGNIAHKYSDEYHNVSILDKEAVLVLAKKLNIDGIMAFAVDPGVVTAAYVAEQMGLPSAGSYRSISILQNKALFREFLTENGFNVPRARGYRDCDSALQDTDYYNFPVIVKPVDSAGSKGVSRVDHPNDLAKAIAYALRFSHSGEFIIEDFLEKKGFSSDTDCFSVHGELKFVSFSDQRFDEKAENPYTPSGYSWPSTIPGCSQQELTREIQRLLTLLDMGTSIYNIEVRECTNGKAYIMEVSPRGGGNRLAEVLRLATGVDLIENAVRAALGMEIVGVEMPKYDGYWAELILHSDRTGRFKALDIDKSFLKDCVVEIDIWVENGDVVEGFSGANEAIGTLVLRFKTQEQLAYAMENYRDWITVEVE